MISASREQPERQRAAECRFLGFDCPLPRPAYLLPQAARQAQCYCCCYGQDAARAHSTTPLSSHGPAGTWASICTGERRGSKLAATGSHPTLEGVWEEAAVTTAHPFLVFAKCLAGKKRNCSSSRTKSVPIPKGKPQASILSFAGSCELPTAQGFMYQSGAFVPHSQPIEGSQSEVWVGVWLDDWSQQPANPVEAASS